MTAGRNRAAERGHPETGAILRLLAQSYPDARCGLEFEDPVQLLIATILSAQCTDERVNLVTRRLFTRYRTPADYLAVPESQLAEEIRACGLHHSKARSIRAACRLLVERHGGEVPRQLPKLLALPGVGRKTANVVLANAYGIPTMAVDTHVFRVANRLGLARSDNPAETERQLCRRIPREEWVAAHHRLIRHGREVCTARRPRCGVCRLAPHCLYTAPGGNREVP